MKKAFFIPAVVLSVAAVVWIAVALTHPEMSLPWSGTVTAVVYGLCADLIALLYLLAFRKKGNSPAMIAAAALELAAIFFLVFSIFTRSTESGNSIFLPIALGLNCCAMILNARLRKKEKTDKKTEATE